MDLTKGNTLGIPAGQDPVKLVCDATNWSRENATKYLNKASGMGISAACYIHYECWKMDDHQLELLGKKIKHIEAICNATQWKWADAEAQLDNAKALGIPNFRYVPYECWKMDDGQLETLGKKCKHIKMICNATQWKWADAEAHLDKAKVLGIPNYRYIPYECWKMDDDQLERLAKKCKHIKTVCRETDWKWEEAETQLDQAKTMGIYNFQYVREKCWTMTEAQMLALSQRNKEKEARIPNVELDKEQQKKLKKAQHLGITRSEFLRKSLWLLGDEELNEFADAVKIRRKNTKLDQDFYVSVICKKTGWDPETAEEKMKEAALSGISELKYVQKATWSKNEAEIDFLIRFLQADQKRIEDNKKTYLSKICAATGWSVAKAELEVLKSKNVCRASYEDYLAFKFWNVPLDEQKEYVTLGMFNKMNMVYNDHIIGRTYLDDKAMFNQTFRDFINRRWFTNRDLSYEDFLKQIEGLDRVLVKPLSATQGIGIEKVMCNISEEENRKAYEKIMAMPESIVEQFIIQHDEVKKFCDTSVNTVRVTTINHNGKCDILYALFRSGRGGTVDNFHAGGVAAAVDVDTGIVCTSGADVNFDFYEIHPYSNLKLKGFQLPHWDKIKEACERACRVVPGVNLIGWDFAITPDGVDMIEGNSGAYIVAQLLYSSEGIGLRKRLVDPYLDVDSFIHKV